VIQPRFPYGYLFTTSPQSPPYLGRLPPCGWRSDFCKLAFVV